MIFGRSAKTACCSSWHLDGSPHLFTPESTVDIQVALGSDIAMVLDECIGYPATHDRLPASTSAPFGGRSGV